MKKYETRLLKVNSLEKAKDILTETARLIKNGELVAFPTETVYGLGANGLDGDACARIYEAKGRPSDNPLILHVADRAMIEEIAYVDELAEKLIAAFCPGPLTLILPKKECVPSKVTGGLDTVGVRMPENDIARAFIKTANVPIAAPSANISGRPSPTTAQAVFKDMEGRIPCIIDGGASLFGLESTIVEPKNDTAIILRPGAITFEMLKEVVSVELDGALVGKNVVPKAPGMKYTHYAPKAKLTLLRGEGEALKGGFLKAISDSREKGESVGVIGSCELFDYLKEKMLFPAEFFACYGKRGMKEEIAKNLYESLRFFDDKAVDVLFGEAVDDEGLGLALMNRLIKASGGRLIDV